MNYFIVPINISKPTKGNIWNYFEEMPKLNQESLIESFLDVDEMDLGDCVLLYITEKGIREQEKGAPGYDKVPGVYAMGTVVKKMGVNKDCTDKNYKCKTVAVRIDENYSLDAPLISDDRFKPTGIEPKLLDVDEELASRINAVRKCK